jgi:hypothetical protein
MVGGFGEANQYMAHGLNPNQSGEDPNPQYNQYFDN